MSAPPFPSVAERYDASRRLYLARDLPGYMSFFTPDLAYRQANGKVIFADATGPGNAREC